MKYKYNKYFHYKLWAWVAQYSFLLGQQRPLIFQTFSTGPTLLTQYKLEQIQIQIQMQIQMQIQIQIQMQIQMWNTKYETVFYWGNTGH